MPIATIAICALFDPDERWADYKCLISTTLEVPIDMIITPQIEAAGCMRFQIAEWKWEEAKKRFPNMLAKVNQKRLRRRD
jgi:hypothetical protein